jgi:hypothetical protein
MQRGGERWAALRRDREGHALGSLRRREGALKRVVVDGATIRVRPNANNVCALVVRREPARPVFIRTDRLAEDPSWSLHRAAFRAPSCSGFLSKATCRIAFTSSPCTHPLAVVDSRRRKRALRSPQRKGLTP